MMFPELPIGEHLVKSRFKPLDGVFLEDAVVPQREGAVDGWNHLCRVPLVSGWCWLVPPGVIEVAGMYLSVENVVRWFAAVDKSSGCGPSRNGRGDREHIGNQSPRSRQCISYT